MSTVDAATDIYVLGTYYSAEGLQKQANVMLSLICVNMGVQIFVLLGQHKRKNWKVKMKKVLISLLFFRPIVDAFRLSTNHKDPDAVFDSLSEMIINKVGTCFCLSVV